MLVIFSLENVKQGLKLELTYLYACWIMHMKCWLEISKWNGKGGQKSIWYGEVWNPMFCHGNITAKLELKKKKNWRAHLVESYCKVWNTSDKNWLRNLFLSYLNKIWLSAWRHHLANLHINFKTWVSLERKEILENSKQHFSAHEVYLFMFQNGLNRKDAIFVRVPL